MNGPLIQCSAKTKPIERHLEQKQWLPVSLTLLPGIAYEDFNKLTALQQILIELTHFREKLNCACTAFVAYRSKAPAVDTEAGPHAIVLELSLEDDYRTANEDDGRNNLDERTKPYEHVQP